MGFEVLVSGVHRFGVVADEGPHAHLVISSLVSYVVPPLEGGMLT